MSHHREALLAESWRRTLASLPTVLARLEYLASLRNANTGTYEHFGLAQRVGPEEADRLIHSAHSEVFQEWLCFDLRRQKQELEDYLSDLGGEKREIIANWLALRPAAAWIPADSRDVERRLFLSDLEILLETIRRD